MQEKAKEILAFINAIEPLKTVTRHSWCSDGRRESVPEHCWRMAVLAFLLAEELPDVDMDKVIKMCLLHDLGEIEGDIPAFEKQDADEVVESMQVKKLIQMLPDSLADKIMSLHAEFNAAKTPEAKLAQALDKLEAVMQHNQADLGTWIDLEYDLNLTYGQAQTAYHPFLTALRELVRQQTIKKMASSGKNPLKSHEESPDVDPGRQN